MRVLLTGGAGFIGSHTAVELLNNGDEVVILDNLVNSSPKSLERVRKITGKDLKFYQGDCRDRELLSKIFTENEIDAVVHFAGLKSVGESVAQPMLYYKTNIDSSIALFETMVEYGVKKLVFSSSATVYGGGDIPHTETQQTGNCTNPYGWTKFMIEKILADGVRANPDMSLVLLRYFNPVGAHASGLIGEMPNGIPNNLMPYISQVAIGIRDHLNIYGNDYPTPDGTGVRDYIHVVDLAKGHLSALKYAEGHSGTEIFNLGTGKGTSVLEMVKAFESATGKKVPYVICDRRPGDVAESYGDTTKAYEKMGWKAELNIVDMCRDTWRWQSCNPNGYDS